MIATRARTHLTDEQARELVERFEKLGEEFLSEDLVEGAKPYGMTLIFHPLAAAAGPKSPAVTDRVNGEST